MVEHVNKQTERVNEQITEDINKHITKDVNRQMEEHVNKQNDTKNVLKICRFKKKFFRKLQQNSSAVRQEQDLHCRPRCISSLVSFRFFKNKVCTELKDQKRYFCWIDVLQSDVNELEDFGREENEENPPYRKILPCQLRKRKSSSSCKY